MTRFRLGPLVLVLFLIKDHVRELRQALAIQEAVDNRDAVPEDVIVLTGKVIPPPHD